MDVLAERSTVAVTPTETGSGFRPVLLALAVIFAVATVVYSATWMYYQRVTSRSKLAWTPILRQPE